MRKATIDGIVTERRTKQMRIDVRLYEMRTLTELLQHTREGTLQTVDKEYYREMMRAIYADKQIPLYLKVVQYDSNNNEIQDMKMTYPDGGR
jgi:hypothetical protein